MKKILLVEDNKQIANAMIRVLNKEYEITHAETYKTAQIEITNGQYDMYILDVILDKVHTSGGLELCKQIRQCDKKTPIIFVTVKHAINFKLGAFKFGANDYLCKPFNMLELRARIKANLNAPNTKTEENTISFKDITLNKDKTKVTRNGTHIKLRKKEFELLEYFLKNPGRTLSRESLINQLWDNPEITSNAVDVHIKNLRGKLNDGFEEEAIKTVYGFGYKLE